MFLVFNFFKNRLFALAKTKRVITYITFINFILVLFYYTIGVLILDLPPYRFPHLLEFIGICLGCYSPYYMVAYHYKFNWLGQHKKNSYTAKITGRHAWNGTILLGYFGAIFMLFAVIGLNYRIYKELMW